MALINHFWLLLAYAGMLLHVLIKIEEERKKGTLTTVKNWMKENVVSMIISIIGIPVLLLTMDTPAVAELLPINNLTSVLLGYQTQSILKSFMSIAGSKLPKNENTESV